MFVYICSKYSKGNVEENVEKAKKYCRDIVDRGDIPVCPHIYFTQFMDDKNPDDRKKAFEINKKLIEHCQIINVYGDDISEGMQEEINYAEQLQKVIMYKGDGSTIKDRLEDEIKTKVIQQLFANTVAKMKKDETLTFSSALTEVFDKEMDNLLNNK